MRLTVEAIGVEETLSSLRGIRADLRRDANSEIRAAARIAASGLVIRLRQAASSSGVPVAPRVASSARVKSDRFPTVSIGGTKRVGRRGAPAARLMWGSEHGPRGEVNHFGVPANAEGYWIGPAVRAFERGPAVTIFRRALFEIIRRHGLAG